MAVPTAQPYNWKQAMPAAYSPATFQSLPPEQRAAEKKKAGCCGCCCCICIIVILVLVLGGAAAGQCSDGDRCAEATSELFTGDEVSMAYPDIESYDVKVTYGEVHLKDAAEAKIAAVSTVREKEAYLEDKVTPKQEGTAAVAKYKTGNAIEIGKDCYYCREAEVDVGLVGGLDMDLKVSFGDIHSDADMTFGTAKITSDSGLIELGGDITTTGDLILEGKVTCVDTPAEGCPTELTVGGDLKLYTGLVNQVHFAKVAVTGELKANSGAGSSTDRGSATFPDVSFADAVFSAAGYSDIELMGTVVGDSVKLTGTGKIKADFAGFNIAGGVVVNPGVSGVMELDNISFAKFGSINITSTTAANANYDLTFACDGDDEVYLDYSYYHNPVNAASLVINGGTDIYDVCLTQACTTKTPLSNTAPQTASYNTTLCAGTSGNVNTVQIRAATGDTIVITTN